MAEELVARGELSKAEAAVHPHRHILTRALGITPQVEVDIWQVVPEEGDRYLLCSDGLSNEVRPEVITEVLSDVPDPQSAADTLVGLANASGGNDNITAVVIDVLVGRSRPNRRPRRPPPISPVPCPPPTSGPPRTGTGGRRPGRGDAARDLHAPGGRTGATEAQGAARITFRVLLFLILLGGLAYGAWYVIKVYVGDSYFVGLQKNQLVIYQGRPGGFLGLEPKIVSHTGVTTAQVGSIVVPALRSGVLEPTRAAANRYVAGLVAAECSLDNPPPSCSTSTSTTVPATAPVTTTTAGTGGF